MPASWSVRIARPVLIALVACALLSGIAGGLMRAGVALPGAMDSAWAGRALLAHAALMLSGFFGTVIALERAVALKSAWAFAAPLASGLSAALLLAGRADLAGAFAVLAAWVFVGVNVVVATRQWAVHTALLLVAALAWMVGSLLFAFVPEGGAAPPWWFAFIVLTIAAERLEMTRLMPRRPGAHGALAAIVVALLAGAALSALAPALGGALYGAALLLLAAWLGAFDIARRTVHAQGLSRYMAVCLLSGYAWLAVAGAAWAGTAALGWAARDWALHALGLGFIVAMVMGHAPVILPAVLRGVKLRFGAWFYLPLALLHASLLLRLAGGSLQPELRACGALLNAAAIALFAATLAGSALAARTRRAAYSSSRDTPAS
jgi:hypothetical protein